MMLANMTVARRLSIGFGLVSLLLLLVIALGLSSMRQIQARMIEIAKVNDVEMRQAQIMDLTVTERALALRNLILLKDEQQIQIEIKRISDQEDKYAAAFNKMTQMFRIQDGTAAEERTLLESIRLQGEQAAPLIKRAQSLAVEQHQEQSYQVLRSELRPVQKKWWDLLRQLIALEEKQNIEAVGNADAAYDSARQNMLIAGGLALMCSVAAAWMITRRLVRQLGCEPDEAALIAAQIAAGNLDVPIHPRSGDTSSLLYAMQPCATAYAYRRPGAVQ